MHSSLQLIRHTSYHDVEMDLMPTQQIKEPHNFSRLRTSHYFCNTRDENAILNVFEVRAK